MESALSSQVLVLNRLWQAVNIIGMERTFSLLCQDHAQIKQVLGDFATYLYLPRLRGRQLVIDAISRIYEQDYANVHRGIHTLSERSTEQY
jgi:selenocysteine lyase/cysteine desulfurase